MTDSFPYLEFSGWWIIWGSLIYLTIEALWFHPLAFGRFLNLNTRYKPSRIKTSPFWPLNPYVYEVVLVLLKVWLLGFLTMVDVEKGNGFFGLVALSILTMHNLYVSSHMWEARTFRVTFTNCAYRLVAMIIIALLFRWVAVA